MQYHRGGTSDPATESGRRGEQQEGVSRPIPLSIWCRCPLQYNFNTNSRRKAFTLRPSTVIIAFDALALLFTLAITIYAWHSVHVFPGSNARSKIGDGPFTDTRQEDNAYSQWDPNRSFDPINWNCLIYPYVKGPTRAFKKAAATELHEEIKRACREGVYHWRCAFMVSANILITRLCRCCLD